MAHSITAKTVSGIIAISDEQYWNAHRETAPESVSRRAADDGFFVIDTKDEAELRIEIVGDGDSRPANVDAYQSVGGTFRLNLPSGSLRIWDPEKNQEARECLSLPAGTYALTARLLDTEDLSHYFDHVKDAVGENDWNYHDRIGRIELTGCGTIALGLVLTAIPFTRAYWWIYVPILLAPYLVAWLLKCTPRYKRAERARSDFENCQPHLILTLTSEDDLSESVRGGTIQFT